jgi:hypothetical protein
MSLHLVSEGVNPAPESAIINSLQSLALVCDSVLCLLPGFGAKLRLSSPLEAKYSNYTQCVESKSAVYVHQATSAYLLPPAAKSMIVCFKSLPHLTADERRHRLYG